MIRRDNVWCWSGGYRQGGLCHIVAFLDIQRTAGIAQTIVWPIDLCLTDGMTAIVSTPNRVCQRKGCRHDGRHDFGASPTVMRDPGAVYNASRQGITDTMVTSGDLVRQLSNNDVACYESSSSV